MQPISAVMLRRCSVALATTLLLAGSALRAQASAGIGATVSVSGTRSVPSLAALGVNNLNFGIVTAGSAHAPTSIATDAGRFNISGEADAPVSISFVLPSVLNGPGAATIPIAFSGTDGIEWSAFPLSNVRFDPSAVHLTTLNSFGLLVISIAGTITPPTGTISGLYSGTIQLTVSY
jgi:hypothetical protein